MATPGGASLDEAKMARALSVVAAKHERAKAARLERARAEATVRASLHRSSLASTPAASTAVRRPLRSNATVVRSRRGTIDRFVSGAVRRGTAGPGGLRWCRTPALQADGRAAVLPRAHAELASRSHVAVSFRFQAPPGTTGARDTRKLFRRCCNSTSSSARGCATHPGGTHCGCRRPEHTRCWCWERPTGLGVRGQGDEPAAVQLRHRVAAR